MTEPDIRGLVKAALDLAESLESASIATVRRQDALEAAKAQPSHVTVDDLWTALKHRCCATKPTDPAFDRVSTIVQVRKADLAAAMADIAGISIERALSQPEAAK